MNKTNKKVQIIDGKYNNNSEDLKITMAFWNIQGALKQKISQHEDRKTISKKAQIETIEQSLSQLAGQQGVALMTICETNLTENDKRRHSTLAKQINNYKQQQTASGMSTSTNYQKINKILEKLNDDKFQVLRLQIDTTIQKISATTCTKNPINKSNKNTSIVT
ncbi:hypothetical protein ABPG72_012139 [Tetrahymena utriculariae]